MLLTEPVLEIETPRNHSAETQERLRQLLASGVTGSTDPRRPDFFEIEDKTRVFYIHIAKASGKVTLLAVWDRDTK
jgi:hypothetical protein